LLYVTKNFRDKGKVCLLTLHVLQLTLHFLQLHVLLYSFLQITQSSTPSTPTALISCQSCRYKPSLLLLFLLLLLVLLLLLLLLGIRREGRMPMQLVLVVVVWVPC